MKSKAAIHVVEVIIWMCWYNVASSSDAGIGTMLNAAIAIPVITVLISVFTEGSWTERAGKYALKTLRRKVAGRKANNKAQAAETVVVAHEETPAVPAVRSVVHFEPNSSSMN